MTILCDIDNPRLVVLEYMINKYRNIINMRELVTLGWS